MATPILDKLNIDLSYKIFDPIETAETNGQVFSSYLRKTYLSRAYGKLVRSLEIIYDNMDEIVPDYYKLISISVADNLVGGSLSYTLDSGFSYKAVYYRPNETTETKRAKEIKPMEYLDYKAGIDSFFTPSYNQRYWTIINDELKLLPEDPKMYNMLLFLAKKRSLFLQEDVDIELPTHYHDLLLVAAASEAMGDNGDINLMRVYQEEFVSGLALVARQHELERRREKENVS
jgi:hypothetical protein